MDYYLSNHEESEAPKAKVTAPISSGIGRRKSRPGSKPNSRPSSNYGSSSKKPSEKKIMRLKFSLEDDEMLKDPMLMLEQDNKFDDSIDQLEHDLIKERIHGAKDKLRKI